VRVILDRRSSDDPRGGRRRARAGARGDGARDTVDPSLSCIARNGAAQDTVMTDEHDRRGGPFPPRSEG
jgi:hypothetical protein